MSRSYQLGLLATVVGVASALYFVPLPLDLPIPFFTRTSFRGPQTKNTSNAKQLSTACQLYADDHGGQFPVHLNELEPDYIPAGVLRQFRCAVLEQGKWTGSLVDWLYFGSGFDLAHPPSILLASPQSEIARESGEEVRLYTQGNTRTMVGKEADYQKLLAETVAQMREKERAPQRPVTPSVSPGQAPQQ